MLDLGEISPLQFYVAMGWFADGGRGFGSECKPMPHTGYCKANDSGPLFVRENANMVESVVAGHLQRQRYTSVAQANLYGSLLTGSLGFMSFSTASVIRSIR
jgi:hypothetical protein